LLELRFTLKPPAGAAAESVKVRFCVPRDVIAMVGCGQLTVAPTVTERFAEVKPGAEAVTVAEPTFTPRTVGCVAGVVAPAAIVTVAGVTVTLLVSELLSVTVVPEAGAAWGKVIAKDVVAPRPTLTLAGRPIAPAVATVTFAVASGMKGVALAWITVVPSVSEVTGTFAVVEPAAKFTVAGTVATAVLLELRLTVTPPGGAAAESVRVRF
jgi:hypothetical protein